MVKLNFSPFANNVLDYVGKPLVTGNGKPVVIKHTEKGFTIELADSPPVAVDVSNLEASYILNKMEAGLP